MHDPATQVHPAHPDLVVRVAKSISGTPAKTVPGTTNSASASITEIAKALGVPSDGNCPLADHEGFQLDAKNDTWNCTTCDFEGDVLELVVGVLGVSQRHAEQLLRAGTQALSPPSKMGPKKGQAPAVTTRQLLSPTFDPDLKDHELLERVAEFYSNTLTNDGEKAIAYLERRGLRDDTIITKFKLGLSNRTMGYHIPEARRHLGARLRSRLRELGVYRSTGREHLAGSLVVPITNVEGQVIQLYGRRIGTGLRPNQARHLTLAGCAQKPLWNVDALKGNDTTIILCEAILDALTLVVNGFEAVVSVLGPNAFTDTHVELMAEHEITQVIVALDRDDDGQHGAHRAAALLRASGIEPFRLVLPIGMDVSEFARRAANPRQALLQLVKAPKWMGTGKGPQLVLPRFTTLSAPEFVEADEGTEDMFDLDLVDDDFEDVHQPDLEDDEPPAEHEIRNLDEPNLPKPEYDHEHDDLTLVIEDRRWRLRGINHNNSRQVMRVNALVTREGFGTHVDTIDIFSTRARKTFIAEAADELSLGDDLLRRDLGRLLLAAEDAQDLKLTAALSLDDREPISLKEREQAMGLLRGPNVLDRVLEDLHQIGIVGEDNNLRVAYLAATSRKLKRPLGIVIQSSSAAGKSSVMDAVLDLIPKEDRLMFSAMSAQSLYYLGGSNLKHKVLALAEEQGARKASYSLKLLQSEGRISISSTGKDKGTGRFKAQEYVVQGPVALFITTTSISLDDELANRCLVLCIDESPAQTAAIQRKQRHARTLSGLVGDDDREAILHVHRNAQRLLRPLRVAIPGVEDLSFTDLRVRARRDHAKWLGLIEASALLHQFQRVVRTIEVNDNVVEFVEANNTDITIATELFNVVMGERIDDLPPMTQRMLLQLDELVTVEAENMGKAKAEFRFSRRLVRDQLGWGHTQSGVHLRRLVEGEFLISHPTKHGRGSVFELAYDGGVDPALEGPHITYDGGMDGLSTAHGRGIDGPWTGGVRGADFSTNSRTSEDKLEPPGGDAQKSHTGRPSDEGHTRIPKTNSESKEPG